SVMVELTEAADALDIKPAAPPETDGTDQSVAVAAVDQSSEPGLAIDTPAIASNGDSGVRAQSPAPVDPAEAQAEGVARVADVLRTATTARWPMYLRNVKQLLRAADGVFDERRYGFAGLVELVRGCQKEGLVRLERDRPGR